MSNMGAAAGLKEMWADKDWVCQWAKTDEYALSHASEELRSDRSVVLACARDGRGFMCVHHTLPEGAFFDDKEIMLCIVKKNPYQLGDCSARLKADREVVLAAVKEDCGALSSADPAVMQDANFWIEVLGGRHGAKALDTEEFKKFQGAGDRSFWLAAVQRRGLALKHAPEEFRSDRELARLAGVRCLDALEFVLEALKAELLADRQFLIATVQGAGDEYRGGTNQACVALSDATENKNTWPSTWVIGKPLADRELVLLAAKAWGGSISFAEEAFRADREVAIAAVSNSADALELLGGDLAQDREVALAAVRFYGSALQLVGEANRDDKDVVLAAVTKDGQALRHASERLRGDREVVEAAVANDWSSIKHASAELKTDRSLVLSVARTNGWVLVQYDFGEFVVFQSDPEIVAAAVASGAVEPERLRMVGCDVSAVPWYQGKDPATLPASIFG